jgi:hypothetical protein
MTAALVAPPASTTISAAASLARAFTALRRCRLGRSGFHFGVFLFLVAGIFFVKIFVLRFSEAGTETVFFLGFIELILFGLVFFGGLFRRTAEAETLIEMRIANRIADVGGLVESLLLEVFDFLLVAVSVNWLEIVFLFLDDLFLKNAESGSIAIEMIHSFRLGSRDGVSVRFGRQV